MQVQCEMADLDKSISSWRDGMIRDDYVAFANRVYEAMIDV